MNPHQEPAAMLGFPRHKPQLFASSGADLARATLAYGFGRDFSIPTRLVMAGTVAVPLVRSALSLRQAFYLPCDDAVFRSILGALNARGRILAFYQSQWRTKRFSALLQGEGGLEGFVQVRPETDSYVYPRAQPTAFRFPEARGEAVVEGWFGRLIEPLPLLHRPVTWDGEKLPLIAEQASTALVGVLQPPEEVPANWKPLHGDLTPSNLRMDRRGQVWLIDWEMARWGPEAGDLLRYAVVDESLRSEDAAAIVESILTKLPHDPAEIGEAARFWLEDPIYHVGIHPLNERDDTTSGKHADRTRVRTEITVLQRLAAMAPERE